MVRVRGVVPQNFLQGVQHPLNFCVDLCHLWEALLCKKILCVLWEDTVCLLVQQRLLHPLSLHLWEAISRMWVRGYGMMPYPPTKLLC